MGRILPGCYGLSHVCTCVSHYVYMFLINTYRERERELVSFTSRDFHNPLLPSRCACELATEVQQLLNF